MTQPQTTPAELVISRTFDAPRALLWKVYTEAEHLAHWWGPKGTTLKIVRLDVRPGGDFVYANVMPDGNQMTGKWVYRAVEAPNHLAFVSSFCDEAGNVVRAPFAASFPLEIANDVAFTEENGKTTVTLSGGPVNPSEEERAFFVSMLPSMQGGFKGTFDQLEAYLATLKG